MSSDTLSLIEALGGKSVRRATLVKPFLGGRTVQLFQSGLPYRSVELQRSRLRLTKKDLSHYLVVAPRTLERANPPKSCIRRRVSGFTGWLGYRPKLFRCLEAKSRQWSGCVIPVSHLETSFRYRCWRMRRVPGRSRMNSMESNATLTHDCLPALKLDHCRDCLCRRRSSHSAGRFIG